MSSKTLEETIAAIHALDLEPIKFKATRSEDGYGWTREHADGVALAYKRYLILHAKYPDMMLAPDQETDRFWHLHILDTRKYAADCEAIFGRFVHHFPYLGLRGEEDAQVLDDAFAAMQRLLAKEFSGAQAWPEGATRAAAWCGVEPGAQAKAAWCGVEPGVQAKAAWCGVEPGAQTKAAWCGIDPGAQAKAAWCGVEPGVLAD